jgi:hypothetical protein
MDYNKDQVNRLKRELLSSGKCFSYEKDKNNSVKICKKYFNINDFNNINEE